MQSKCRVIAIAIQCRVVQSRMAEDIAIAPQPAQQGAGAAQEVPDSPQDYYAQLHRPPDVAPMAPLQDAQLPGPDDAAQPQGGAQPQDAQQPPDDAHPQDDAQLEGDAQPQDAQHLPGAAQPQDDAQLEGDAQPQDDAQQPPGAAQPQDDAQLEGDAQPQYAQQPQGAAQPEPDAQPPGAAQPQGDAEGQDRAPRVPGPACTPRAVQRLDSPNYVIRLDSKQLSWKCVEVSTNKGKRHSWREHWCDRTWRTELKSCMDMCWARDVEADQSLKPTDEVFNAVVTDIEPLMANLPATPINPAKRQRL